MENRQFPATGNKMSGSGSIRTLTAVSVLLLSSLSACDGGGAGPALKPEQAGPASGTHDRLLIVGQDLGAIRGYLGSNCCPRPDGLTAYVDFYDILKPGDFGGLGIDADGEDAGFDFDWGSGPINAWRTATGFGINGLAIGLSITENEHPGKLARLVDGEFDAEIRQLGRFSNLIEGPVYLRIGYEFDGAWNHGYQNTQSYIGAWRRIVDVLRQAGVNNVEFVWQASASTTDDVIDGRHEDITQWYPGDEYVDWMAVSWFLQPRETVEVAGTFVPLTPLELTEEVLDFARQRGKPVMIAEAAPQGINLRERFTANHSPIWDGPAGEDRKAMSDDEIWAHWFAPLFELLDDNRDVLYALAYINVDWDSQAMWGPPYSSGFWGDSRLEVNAEIARRFGEAVEAWKRVDDD